MMGGNYPAMIKKSEGMIEVIREFSQEEKDKLETIDVCLD